MNPDDAPHGIALVCDQTGVILNVLHNSVGITESEIIGSVFPLLATRSSFQKALSFLVELRAKRMVSHWELELRIQQKSVLAHCAGLAFEDSLLIIAAQTRFAADHLFFEEMMRINNEQTNLSRAMFKEQVERFRAQPSYETESYEQLSKINNELVSLQRELAKKNVELERLNAEVQRLAIVDELTNIYNRRGFFEIGRRQIAQAKRFGRHLSAILFDIDHFKQVNDIYGHAIGDKVLAEVATRCGQQLRDGDIFGRYGGDEFAVLLPEISITNAYIVAERLREQCAAISISTNQGLLAVHISLGVASLNDKSTDLNALLEFADQALYKAKQLGRNQVYLNES